jgi:hypothetical protein
VEGTWTTAAIAPLEDGEYTAVATQPPPSSLAGNPEGASEAVTFRVESRLPSVTEPTASASLTSAWLNASVDSNGGTLDSCSFQYGLTPAYGKAADCAFEGSGTECEFKDPPASSQCAFPAEGTRIMYARVFGLGMGTTYYFRLVVENVGGKGRNASAEGSFATESLGGEGPAEVKPKPKTAGPAIPSISEVQALIGKQLAPSGKAARIASLLKRGVFSTVLKVPEAGTAVMDWYFLPKGASLSGKASSSHKAVLVASGDMAVQSATTATIRMRLTALGKRLLRDSKKIRLTAQCVFTPSGAAPITTQKSFELSR